MSFDFESPEEVHGEDGKWCKEPGTYHFTVANILEGQTEKGTPIDGFTVKLEALAGGTVEGCQGQQHTETVFAPNLSQSEESQSMAKRKLAAFFIACDLMTPEQLGKPVQIELEQAVGRQLVAELAKRYDKDETTGKYTKETKYLQFHYANIYHVDDPDVKDIPKNADAIGLIGKEHRHDEEYFAPLKKKNGKKASQPSQPVAAASAATSFDDLFE